ncbi:MAG TPA: hypothetical protein VM933_02960 [Acidimicrobiales bacterium]|nr:hypothetical protein [Acidimicrobiales bacterium]
MLYAFAFDKVGVVVGDLYFQDPRPGVEQEGPEQGVRLEVRFVDKAPLNGSIYSAQPIAVDRPIWRADLLESIGSSGSFDRTHHHPRFRGWEPVRRHFVEELSADPVAWVGARLADFPSLLDEAGVDAAEVPATDVQAVRAAVPEILDAVQRLLDRVRAGELGQPPADGVLDDSARVGWL